MSRQIWTNTTFGCQVGDNYRANTAKVPRSNNMPPTPVITQVPVADPVVGSWVRGVGVGVALAIGVGVGVGLGVGVGEGDVPGVGVGVGVRISLLRCINSWLV